MISVGYLALAPAAVDTHAPDSAWSALDAVLPLGGLARGPPAADRRRDRAGAASAGPTASAQRLGRARLLFALDGAPWNEERVLERYELLYEAALAPGGRPRPRARERRPPAEPPPLGPAFGEPMVSDHRRILATGLGRLRGKLKYRPVVFELMPRGLHPLGPAARGGGGRRRRRCTSRTSAAMVERTGLVEGLGRMDAETGGRPAELFRFRREMLAARPASGLSLPLLRD